jgi:hypothetical protein
VQSKKPEVLSAIHRGDAFLTRLEGEWWARFSDPDWPRQQIPSGARVTGGSGVSDTRPVRVG